MLNNYSNKLNQYTKYTGGGEIAYIMMYMINFEMARQIVNA